MPGRDYSLPGGAGQVVVEFAPGETSKVLPVIVLDNPERSAARTVALHLSGTATAGLDEVRSVELVLAPYVARGYLPLTVR